MPVSPAIRRLAVLGLLLALLAGCDLLRQFGASQAREIVEKHRFLTLAWDPPLTDLRRTESEVVAYRVYYRSLQDGYWTFLDEVPSSEHPEYKVTHERLGDGQFVFAVRAVVASGRVSPLHSSLDDQADPMGGWYVFWVSP